jgi:serine/threonine protein kinase
MALSAGDKLGPYEILSAIGAGGMWEVWKVRGTQLDRIVAIKKSKVEFNERFEREARRSGVESSVHLPVVRHRPEGMSISWASHFTKKLVSCCGAKAGKGGGHDREIATCCRADGALTALSRRLTSPTSGHILPSTHCTFSFETFLGICSRFRCLLCL